MAEDRQVWRSRLQCPDFPTRALNALAEESLHEIALYARAALRRRGRNT